MRNRAGPLYDQTAMEVVHMRIFGIRGGGARDTSARRKADFAKDSKD